MTYAIHEHAAIQVVQVNNLFNELENNIILQEIKSRIEKGFNDFIVDLSELDFMNSVGLNFLLSLMNAAKTSGGYFAIANANEQVINLLRITKLSDMFTLTSTVEEALQKLEQSN